MGWRRGVALIAATVAAANLAGICLGWPSGRHWLNVHLWAPMWPNMLAPSLVTLAWVGFLHVRAKVHLARHHEALKQHITATAGKDGNG
jgi:hypothetical protein